MPEIETCSTRDRGYMGDPARGASLGRGNRTAAGRATVLRSEIASLERVRLEWTQEDSRHLFAPGFNDSNYAELGERLARFRAELAAIESAPDLAPRFHLRRVRLNSGGYDSGGAYWGPGGQLFEAFTADGAEFMTMRVMRGDVLEAFERRGGVRIGEHGHAEFRKAWPAWHAIGEREAARDMVRADYPDARFYR